MTSVPRWRIACAVAVLVALAGFGAMLVPVYARNLQLQNYMDDMTRHVDGQKQPDEAVRQKVLQKAKELDLPVLANNVQVFQSPNSLRIDVHYFVRVKLSGYTVDLHFSPGAGNR